MNLQEFAAFHVPALAADEARFGVPIAALEQAVATDQPGFRFWHLGAPGHCAVKTPGYGILLGDLDRDDCARLAETVASVDYPGVVGVDLAPPTFVECAAATGATFDAPEAMRIHTLVQAPKFPGVAGAARVATIDDAPLLREWLNAFRAEATPRDPPVSREEIDRAAAGGRYMFWIVNGEPVSMAAVARSLRGSLAIGGVYTPPELRARGYAGSATAALCQRAFAEGKRFVTLYTDLANPFSNRCYAKIGFSPWCEAWHFHRRAGTGG